MQTPQRFNSLNILYFWGIYFRLTKKKTGLGFQKELRVGVFLNFESSHLSYFWSPDPLIWHTLFRIFENIFKEFLIQINSNLNREEKFILKNDKYEGF